MASPLIAHCQWASLTWRFGGLPKSRRNRLTNEAARSDCSVLRARLCPFDGRLQLIDASSRCNPLKKVTSIQARGDRLGSRVKTLFLFDAFDADVTEVGSIFAACAIPP